MAWGASRRAIAPHGRNKVSTISGAVQTYVLFIQGSTWFTRQKAFDTNDYPIVIVQYRTTASILMSPTMASPIIARLRLTMLAVAVAVAASPVRAQARAQVMDTAAVCAEAVKALSAGSVESRPVFTRPSCGANVAGAVAGAFRGAAQSADTVLWAELYALTVDVLDTRMINAAEAVARDRTASVPARAVTMSALVTAYRPGAFIILPGWRALLESSFVPERHCVQVMTPGPTVFGVLPAGLAPRIAATLDGIAADVASPSVVRAFATCARRVITEVATRPRELSATYVCDNAFAVTTSAQATDGARVRVGGEPGLRQLAQWKSTPMQILLSGVRDLQLFINDQLVASARHGRVSCLATRYRQSGQKIPAGVDTLAGWAR